MRKFLAFLIIVQLGVAAGVLAVDVLVDPGDDDLLRSTPDNTTLPTVYGRLQEGQAEVTGVLTALHADAAVGDPIPAPFTVEPGQRGRTRAIISNAVVAGRRQAISWDGGRPLPITGTGGLELGAAALTVDGGGITWTLDGAPRPFLPGSYATTFTVAVGREGLGTVRNGVAWEADDQTVMTTRDGAFVVLPPAPFSIRAPGDSTLSMDGDLVVRTRDGSRRVRSLQFGPGLYTIDLTPGEGGYAVTALLQGPVQV